LDPATAVAALASLGERAAVVPGRWPAWRGGAAAAGGGAVAATAASSAATAKAAGPATAAAAVATSSRPRLDATVDGDGSPLSDFAYGYAPPPTPPPSSSAPPAARGGHFLSLAASLRLLLRLVRAVNARLRARYEADVAAALGAVRGAARFRWLHELGGRGRLGPGFGGAERGDGPLVFSYFARVPAAAPTHASAPATIVLACNGFIWDGDPEVSARARSARACVRTGGG
jgi:hypothetical protein